MNTSYFLLKKKYFNVLSGVNTEECITHAPFIFV